VTVATIPDLSDFAYAAMRKAERVGRPVGSKNWLKEMEQKAGQKLMVRKPGPKGERG
jgi:putative transposase